jgi:hypothetical protein
MLLTSLRLASNSARTALACSKLYLQPLKPPMPAQCGAAGLP